ncbi:MAG: hypothetical protein PHH77_07685 [Victivallaceae bacterium]|nr:hypothetical protein [Victivallaceae bacterium]
MTGIKNTSSGPRNTHGISGMKPQPASFYLDDSELSKQQYNIESAECQGVASASDFSLTLKTGENNV